MAWVYLFQGGRYDTASGLYNFRNRDYSPTLGRWIQVDPLRYAAEDANLYRYEQDDPSVLGDPFGLYGGHHWFPQDAKFQDRIKKLCPTLSIHDFTTPSLRVYDRGPDFRRIGVGLASAKKLRSIHYFLEHEFKYHDKFEKVLNSSKTCCDLILGVADLIGDALKEIAANFFPTAGIKFDLTSFWSCTENSQQFYALVEECLKKCPKPRPSPVREVGRVPQPAPVPSGRPATSRDPVVKPEAVGGAVIVITVAWGIWEVIKWGGAILAAPETGGGSLAVGAALP